MEGLVSSAEHMGGNRREVVARVDPLSNDDRRRQNSPQNREIPVATFVIRVEEDPPLEVKASK